MPMAGLPDERETTAANLIVVGGDELSGVNLKGHADNRTFADDGHRIVFTQQTFPRRIAMGKATL